MKSVAFLFIAIFVYVDADVYTITTSELTSENEAVLSISSQSSSDGPDDDKTCPDDYVVVRQKLEDTSFYDGYAIYADTEVRKVIEFCNNDVTEVAGTISYILLNALGFDNDDEIACPIDEGETCFQKEFKMVAGNFMGVFENDTSEATLEIYLPVLLKATFSISKQDGLPIPESETDSSAEEENEIQEEIDEGEQESANNPDEEASAGEGEEALADEEEQASDKK